MLFNVYYMRDGSKSDEDIEIYSVDEFGYEIFGTLGGGELVPILDICVEV